MLVFRKTVVLFQDIIALGKCLLEGKTVIHFRLPENSYYDGQFQLDEPGAEALLTILYIAFFIQQQCIWPYSGTIFTMLPFYKLCYICGYSALHGATPIALNGAP